MERNRIMPRKLETCFYRYNKADYLSISSVISRRKTPLGICPEPSLALNTKCGRLTTWGFTFDKGEYDRRVKGIELMAQPYYDNWDDVKNVTDICSHMPHITAMVIDDLLRWGVAQIPSQSSELSMRLFNRTQLYFEHHFDLMVRACWPCFRDRDRLPILFIDYGSLMLP